MVNTFLPKPDFHESARLLDNKRLGKQRVEAWQILKALMGQSKGWRHHPATLMWEGHERSLCEYGMAICDEWISRGYKDTLRPRFEFFREQFPEGTPPPWLGNPQFHLSHQSNLKRKDAVHYQFDVPDNLPYEWNKA